MADGFSTLDLPSALAPPTSLADFEVPPGADGETIDRQRTNFIRAELDRFLACSPTRLGIAIPKGFLDLLDDFSGAQLQQPHAVLRLDFPKHTMLCALHFSQPVFSVSMESAQETHLRNLGGREVFRLISPCLRVSSVKQILLYAVSQFRGKILDVPDALTREGAGK